MIAQIAIVKPVGWCLVADSIIAVRTAEFGRRGSGNYIGTLIETLIDGPPDLRGSAPEKVCAYVRPFFALLGEERAAAVEQARQLAGGIRLAPPFHRRRSL